MKIDEALKELRNHKRNFQQSFDLVINLKNIDLKKPENKFSKDILLPNGRGKPIKTCIFSDNMKKTENFDVVSKSQIESMEKKEMKSISKKYDFFMAEAPLMPVVGKFLGRYLAPKGKMPKPLPPGRDVNSILNDLNSTVRIRVRDSPVIQTLVGHEKLSDDQVKENLEKIIDEITKTLPKGKTQIKNIYIKTTMSKPVKLQVF